MTPRATSTPEVSPTIAAASIRPIFEALERLGYDGGRLLAAAGTERERLLDPDARIPCAAPGALLAAAQRERARANLALDLASVTPIGAFPLIDYLMVSSETPGEGFERLARYYRLIGAGSLAIRENDDVFEVHLEQQEPFFVEYSVALSLLQLARESHGRARALVVHFVHQPGDARAYEEAFGCPVRSSSTWNGFAMAREVWRMPMPRRDSALLGVLERHADEMLGRIPAPGDVARVRHALVSGLPRGEADIEAVARSLALAPRTLQRRLAAAGTTFQRLLEDTRRDAAARQLEGTELSIGEIAFVLGYSEPAAFHRAFRRWYRTTPQAFRALKHEVR